MAERQTPFGFSHSYPAQRYSYSAQRYSYSAQRYSYSDRLRGGEFIEPAAGDAGGEYEYEYEYEKNGDR